MANYAEITYSVDLAVAGIDQADLAEQVLSISVKLLACLREHRDVAVLTNMDMRYHPTTAHKYYDARARLPAEGTANDGN